MTPGIKAAVPFALVALGTAWLASIQGYVPHVDDLFFYEWARAEADGGKYPPHALSRFLPSPDYFHLVPRLHVHAMAFHFNLFGSELGSGLWFRALVYALTSLIVIWIGRRRDMPMLAVLFPVLLCASMLHTGFRPEATSVLAIVAGVALLWRSNGMDGSADLARRILAKTLIMLSPLAAPSALGYGAGLLIASDLHDLRRRRPITRLAIEGVAALAIAVFVLGLNVGFDFPAFLKTYLPATEEVDLFGFSPSRLAKGVLLLAVAAAIFRAAPDVAVVVAGIGLGSLFSLVLHNKVSISTPLTGFALLMAADVASRSWRARPGVWAGMSVGLVLMLANQAIFLFSSRADAAAQTAVRAAAAEAAREGRPLLVDEVTAFHGLGLDLGKAQSWTWGIRHPETRPRNVEVIAEGERWIVSKYTLYSWLRPGWVAGFPLEKEAGYPTLRGLPCLVGRNSCRFPRVKWGYFLVQRRNGKVDIRALP